jgi:hypothetical protein
MRRAGATPVIEQRCAFRAPGIPNATRQARARRFAMNASRLCGAGDRCGVACSARGDPERDTPDAGAEVRDERVVPARRR